MKNHIAFKFLAVLLCAASLLGAVGSALAVFVLTEGDLYEKTVEQVYEEQLTLQGQHFADQTAITYASLNLGGMPSVTVDQVLGYHNYFREPHYGYRLLDADGKELESRMPDGLTISEPRRIPVRGNYLHLVEVTSISKELEKEQNTQTVPVIDSGSVQYDAIPETGAAIGAVEFMRYNGSDGANDGSNLGTAFRGADGTVILRVQGWNIGMLEQEEPVLGVVVMDTTGALIYQAHSENGVGYLSYALDGSGDMIFRSFPAPALAAPAEATEPTKVTEAVSEETEGSAEETAATEGTEETVEETVPPETVPPETLPEETEPVLINGKPLSEYQINRDGYYDETLGENVTVEYVYVPMPEMTVELYLAPGAVHSEAVYTVLAQVRQIRGYLFPAMGICLLLFAITAVYLCCAAGRKPKSEEVRASGLNRIPLDLYAGILIFGIAGLAVAGVEGGAYLLEQNVNVGMAFCGGCAFLACLLFVGFCFAFVAQIKTPGGFWWRHSLCGICLKLCIRLIKGLWRLCCRSLPWLVWLVKECWKLLKSLWLWFWGTLARFYKWLYKGLSRIYDLLPITWQWILSGGVMVLFLFITLAGRFDFGIVLAVIFAFALILYGAHCFGTLMEATRKMNRGDLSSKADDKMMLGAFRDFAHDLNDLANVAVVAAQKQLKSERMKTDLITNVSHDIKTPLTSIINYVDLLRKAETEEEKKQYLEVLDRQSQRLKKLIEDLMEMSKASTGNMAVDITLVDAVESVNQALGEFNDKLDRAQLVPVFRHTEPSVTMMADGRLVWRVLSNLLSNAVKYAMPGTRLYIDLMQLEGKVVISLKNISREELNVDAEELMERFVRGDGSRNTEGSGLGLNIAKSLMELQKGQLQLLVDGDLFKVTLIFPGV